MYSLRCGVVHQGQFGKAENRYDRVAFLLPTPGAPNLHLHGGADIGEIQAEGKDLRVLYLTPQVFCSEIVGAVTEWYAGKSTDPNVIKNMRNLIGPYRGTPPLVDATYDAIM